MTRYRGLYFLCGIILYIMANLVMFSHVKVFAQDIADSPVDDEIVEAIEIIDHEDEAAENDEGVLIDKMDRVTQVYDDENNSDSTDDIQDSPDVLQDSSDDILFDELKPSQKSSTRSMVNTYTNDNNWEFVQSYYSTVEPIYYLVNGVSRRRNVGIFQKNKLPSYNNIMIYVNDNDFLLHDYPDLDVYVVYLNENVDFKSMHDALSDYLDNYGYPDSNCYWEAPEPTGTPDPTVTPEPTGTPDPNEWPDYSNFFYIVIFGFGLLAGIIAGDILTRFIKK